MAIDVDSLLEELSADAPCGDDLEYDPEMGELERAAAGKEEQQFGDTVIAATEPDYPAMRSAALALLDRTRDLRILPYLVRSLVHTDGYDGVRDVLSLLCGYLERFWGTVHPQLDADDDNDPTLRVNTIRALSDATTVLTPLRQAPLVSVRGIGSFGLLDLAIASGEVSPGADANAVEPGMIEGAFAQAPLDDLQATAASVQAARAHLATVDELLLDRVGAEHVPDMGPLDDVLRHAERALSDRLARRGGNSDEDGDDTDDLSVASDSGLGSVPARRASSGGGFSGEFESRDQIVTMLDSACRYYTRFEPSSPVPILLRRAKTLVHMDFMAIVKDLVPDGFEQAERFQGASESNEDDFSDSDDD